MKAALILQQLDLVGVVVRVDGSDLCLSGDTAPPDELIAHLRQYKVEVIACLEARDHDDTAPDKFNKESAGFETTLEPLCYARLAPGSWQAELAARAAQIQTSAGVDEQEAQRRAYAWLIVLWQRANPPEPCDRDRCRICGAWLIEPIIALLERDAGGSAIFLHDECHEPYCRQRQTQAEAALAQQGVGP